MHRVDTLCMETFSLILKASDEDSEVRNNQRRHGRVRCGQIESSLGTVSDISASGLRVFGPRPGPAKGDVVVLEVHCLDGAFVVQARIAWVKNHGLFARESGLEFIDLAPFARAVLLAAVRSSSATTTGLNGW